MDPVDYEPGQEVDLLIWTRSDIGHKAIINQKHSGLLYFNEIFHDVMPGQMMKGYISRIRPDGKIDLKLQKTGYDNIDQFSEILLQSLENSQGFIPLTDKSDPEEIYRLLGMSKKNFKKCVGLLYKRRLIRIDKSGIYLIKK